MYSQKNLKTMDTFALVLVGIGLWLIVVALRPYTLRKQYLYPMYGFRTPRMLIAPCVEGALFVTLSAVLAIAVHRHQPRRLDSPL